MDLEDSVVLVEEAGIPLVLEGLLFLVKVMLGEILRRVIMVVEAVVPVVMVKVIQLLKEDH